MDELPQIETAADIEMSGPVRDDLAARVMVVVVISLVVAMAVVFSWFNRRLLIPDVISKIALEGTMTPETAAQFLQEQVEQMYADRLGG